MSENQHLIVYDLTVAAPARQVFRAFTNATWLREWFCDLATVDPKPGGRIYLAWNSGFYMSGSYNEIDEDKAIAFRWFGRDDPGPTQVRISLAHQSGRTQLHLEHSGGGSGEAWEAARKEFRKGWDLSLENLVSVLETGVDLRFVRRPMIGIILTEFNEEIARHLNVPVKHGIRLDGLVDGMGAQKAGLQPDDVIVQIAGKPTTDYPSLVNALSGYRAGDTVEVKLYRGSQLLTLPMTLSGRSLPELPKTIEAFARAVQLRYGKIEAEMEEFLDSISEEEACFSPGPDEWNVKQVIAHLLHGERGYQNYIGDVVTGFEPFYDDYGGNLNARINATVAVYPTLNEIWQAYKISMRETCALVANLPEEFLLNKGSYHRLAYSALEDPYHDQVHMEQMERAVDAARQRSPA